MHGVRIRMPVRVWTRQCLCDVFVCAHDTCCLILLSLVPVPSAMSIRPLDLLVQASWQDSQRGPQALYLLRVSFPSCCFRTKPKLLLSFECSQIMSPRRQLVTATQATITAGLL